MFAIGNPRPILRKPKKVARFSASGFFVAKKNFGGYNCLVRVQSQPPWEKSRSYFSKATRFSQLEVCIWLWNKKICQKSFRSSLSTNNSAKFDSSIWFIANDVCNILCLTNPTMAVNRLKENERAKFNLGRSDIHGGGGETNFVNEPGLYRLIFASNKP